MKKHTLMLAIAALATCGAVSAHSADEAKAPSNQTNRSATVALQPFQRYDLAVYRGQTLLAQTRLRLSPNMTGASSSMTSLSYAKGCESSEAPDGTLENIKLKPGQLDTGLSAQGVIAPFGATADRQIHIDASFVEWTRIDTVLVKPNCIRESPVIKNTHIVFNIHEPATGSTVEQTYDDKRVVLTRVF